MKTLIGTCALAGVFGLSSIAFGGDWTVADQPDLKAQLDAAPPAKVETLAPAVKTIQPWTAVLAPNRDGKTYDVIQWYFQDYAHNTFCYIVDTATGAVKKQTFPNGIRADSIHWQNYSDGNMYGSTSSSSGVWWYKYDPDKNEIERLANQKGITGETCPTALGPDGRIYGACSRNDVGQADAYWFDPRTGETHDYGPVGPSHKPYAAYGYYMGVDDQYIYIASGKIPAWYLLAVNIQTGECKTLMQRRDSGGNFHIHPQFPGCWVNVVSDDEKTSQQYWLYHGAAIEKKDNNPPWPPKASPASLLPPRPEVYSGQIDPDDTGVATLWYRSAEDAAKAPKVPPAGSKPEEFGWKAAKLMNIETYPLSIHRIVPLPDGRIFGTAQAYKGRFMYDPKTNKVTELGRGGASPYAFTVYQGKIYWSGYSNAPIFVIDPDKPWTVGKGGPPGEPPPDIKSPTSNTREIGTIYPETRVKKVVAACVGADNKVYFGGFGQRDYAGGGLGWYNPKDNTFGGFWKPFSGYRVHWVVPTLDGKQLIVSTRTASDILNGNKKAETGRIYIYDVAKGEIVRFIEPVAKAVKAGPVVEVAPGRLLGTTEDPEVKDGGILYGVDLNTGEVLFRKKVPYSLSFGWHEGITQWDFQRGPDGFVWTTLGKVLVRIDPKDARVNIVGTLARNGKYAFVGKDLYLAGDVNMRRIMNAAQ